MNRRSCVRAVSLLVLSSVAMMRQPSVRSGAGGSMWILGPGRDRRGGLLGAGRIRRTMDEVEIEHVARYGDLVVVMGRDTVDGPPTNDLTHRRFTNIWQLQDGAWRMIARHAQVVAPR